MVSKNKCQGSRRGVFTPIVSSPKIILFSATSAADKELSADIDKLLQGLHHGFQAVCHVFNVRSKQEVKGSSPLGAFFLIILTIYY